MSTLATRVRRSIGLSPTKGVVRVHHGSIDAGTVTTRPPAEVMKLVHEALMGMGVDIYDEGEFKYRCVRKKFAMARNANNSPTANTVGSLLYSYRPFDLFQVFLYAM